MKSVIPSERVKRLYDLKGASIRRKVVLENPELSNVYALQDTNWVENEESLSLNQRSARLFEMGYGKF